ncbi:L-glyceraldehyde 3-phosphate reductase [Turicibacter sanguinis]|uniref:L-glyceraldehyde 3-phosphate reductase n=2 Tax=Turicibacter sanguinis TaxID=154288 RepID=A0A9X4XFU2_9FIRM|nr:aldo/keto reductase [Turicibacter sanguinis]EFF64382.1 oxidoreductase, aldo/keto reductase family protein [Turicibacter sanguinis PC909]MCU7192107.1 aldo/keto reductase [Turicibacter sanguinis]MTK22218.1 L-glyceraldehyde 3-phosphate reductase [Turicibacter sanguinis]MTK73533.1 L-glyceraldehyde 3-phosphate reductase [Turicibacter sanguinis]
MYRADDWRYGKMSYHRCGNSGLKLPAISLGLWHNFGDTTSYENSREMITTAFDHGINHFDLANNYGPPVGAAEMTFGRVLKDDLKHYRDEILISTKAGYKNWEGPYGDFGSKKHLLASLDRSLKRMDLDYVDIFYHHRPDKETPIEETMSALAQTVKQGKALYIGLSKYNVEETKEALAILKDLKTPCLIHQTNYSMLNRTNEEGLFDLLEREKIGAITFSAMAGGKLTNRYLNGIPEDSRAGKDEMKASDITPELIAKVKLLNKIAQSRGQSLAQMAVSWVLKNQTVTSVIVGASRTSQIIDTKEAVHQTEFSAEELKMIDAILLGKMI